MSHLRRRNESFITFRQSAPSEILINRRTREDFTRFSRTIEIQLGSPWMMLIGPGANYAWKLPSEPRRPLPTAAKFATLLRSIKQLPSYLFFATNEHWLATNESYENILQAAGKIQQPFFHSIFRESLWNRSTLLCLWNRFYFFAERNDAEGCNVSDCFSGKRLGFLVEDYNLLF